MPLDDAMLRYLASRDPRAIDTLLGGPAPGGLAGKLQDLGVFGNRGRDALITSAPQVQQTVNVPPPSRDASGAVLPKDDDEKALASQAGWAGAAGAVAPLLGDWRTTPLQVLTSALAGYQTARYGAQQDIAEQRRADQLFEFEKQKAQAEQAAAEQQAAQQQALFAEIGAIQDPEERRIAMLDPGAYAAARAKAFEPKKPVQLGDTLFDPETLQPIAQAPLSLADQARLGLERARLALEQQKAKQGPAPTSRFDISNGVILDKFTGAVQRVPFDGNIKPDTLIGKLLAERDALPPDDPRRASYDAAIAKESTRGDGISLGVDENGNPKVTIGGPGTPAVTQAGQNKISQYRAARENLNAAITDYKNLVDRTGGTIDPGSAEAVGLDAAQTRVMMSAKNLYELGAPTGPDMELLRALVPGTTGLSGVRDPRGKVAAGLDALEKDVQTMTSAIERGYGGEAAVSRPRPDEPPPIPLKQDTMPNGGNPEQKKADDDEYQRLFGLP